jgi:hypothetical protein
MAQTLSIPLRPSGRPPDEALQTRNSRWLFAHLLGSTSEAIASREPAGTVDASTVRRGISEARARAAGLELNQLELLARVVLERRGAVA